tara:strand:+ start:750 stop:1439 length:690 start_codon:yes stop_codon:yes gene_type:complete
MNDLPHTILPDHLTLLLKANMASNGQLHRELDQYIYKRKDLYELVRRHFPDVNQYGAVGKLIKSVGWIGFRDKITSLYLNYMWNGSYDSKQEPTFISDVLAIESFVSHNCLQNYSRGFLLGLYLKSAELSGQNLDSQLRAKNIVNDTELKGMLRAMGSRVIKIDWLILQLLHFRNYLGFASLVSMLNRACSYAEIFGELSMDQREELTINMLAYGASINETNIFIERPV